MSVLDGDIGAYLENFVVARAGGEVIGTVGLEPCGQAGPAPFPGRVAGLAWSGVAQGLYVRILARAHLLGLRSCIS